MSAVHPAGTAYGRRIRLVMVVLSVLTAATLAACSSEASGTEDGPDVLRILAGSEVKDLEPMLQRSGVKVKISYTGTLDGAEQVASGGADGSYDAIWFSSNRYLSLIDGASARLSTETKIMASPCCSA